MIEGFESVGEAEYIHKQAIQHYINIYLDHKQELSHYYETVYRIIKFIEDSDLEEKDKQLYSKILRAQFTESELFLLYYNSLTDYGQNFQPLILRFNLLKHLSPISKIVFKKFYYAEIDNKILANMFVYCDFLKDLISTFIIDVREKEFEERLEISLDVTNESRNEVSMKYRENGPTFELRADSLTRFTLTIHFDSDNNFIRDDLNLENELLIDFHKNLLNDLLSFSIYKGQLLDIVDRIDERKISFSINSEDGFEICSDKY